MKIRYLLKKKAADYLVYLALYDGEITELISTGQRMLMKDWSVKEKQPKDHKSPVFRAIERIKAEVQKVILKIEADEQIATPFVVKSAYQTNRVTLMSVSRSKDKKAKLEAITVVKLATNWRDNELFRFRANTQRAVRHSINKFITWMKAHGMAGLERSALTHHVIDAYDRHILTKKLSDNTHGRLMKHLRWFLKSIGMDTKFIKIRTVKKTIVSLTLEELHKLEAVDVSNFIEWQQAKDVFLLGCYTGLRISDIKRLNKVNTRNRFITLKTQKNSKFVRIPIIQACAEILSRYDYQAPRLPQQKVNEFIKKVCKKAGIDELVNIDSTRGGVAKSESKPKYSLMSTHVSSKTFITLAPVQWGLTPAEIADIVGKDLRTLLQSYFNNQGEIGRQKMIDMDRTKMKVI